jgi:hypothetical protein
MTERRGPNALAVRQTPQARHERSAPRPVLPTNCARENVEHCGQPLGARARALGDAQSPFPDVGAHQQNDLTIWSSNTRWGDRNR